MQFLDCALNLRAMREIRCYCMHGMFCSVWKKKETFLFRRLSGASVLQRKKWNLEIMGGSSLVNTKTGCFWWFTLYIYIYILVERTSDRWMWTGTAQVFNTSTPTVQQWFCTSLVARGNCGPTWDLVQMLRALTPLLKTYFHWLSYTVTTSSSKNIALCSNPVFISCLTFFSLFALYAFVCKNYSSALVINVKVFISAFYSLGHNPEVLCAFWPSHIIVVEILRSEIHIILLLLTLYFRVHMLAISVSISNLSSEY